MIKANGKTAFKAPYGFKIVNGEIVQNLDEMPMINLIRDFIDENDGVTISQICHYLQKYVDSGRIKLRATNKVNYGVIQRAIYFHNLGTIDDNKIVRRHNSDTILPSNITSNVDVPNLNGNYSSSINVSIPTDLISNSTASNNYYVFSINPSGWESQPTYLPNVKASYDNSQSYSTSNIYQQSNINRSQTAIPQFHNYSQPGNVRSGPIMTSNAPSTLKLSNSSLPRPGGSVPVINSNYSQSVNSQTPRPTSNNSALRPILTNSLNGLTPRPSLNRSQLPNTGQTRNILERPDPSMNSRRLQTISPLKQCYDYEQANCQMNMIKKEPNYLKIIQKLKDKLRHHECDIIECIYCDDVIFNRDSWNKCVQCQKSICNSCCNETTPETILCQQCDNTHFINSMIL